MEKLSNLGILKNLIGSYRILFILFTALILSVLFPRVRSSVYDFEEGSKWRYSDLRADNSFAIKKPENQVIKERMEITKDFPPYYRTNGIKKDEIQAKVEFIFQTVLLQSREPDQDKLKSKQTYFIEELVNLCYTIQSIGIINIAKTHFDKSQNFLIYVEDNGSIDSRLLFSIPSLAQAKQSIKAKVVYLKLPSSSLFQEKLLSVLEENIEFDESLTNSFLQQALENVSPNAGVVEKGDLIVSKNSVITKDVYQKLASLQTNNQDGKPKGFAYIKSIVGYFSLLTFILLLYFLYIRNYVRDVFIYSKKLLFMNIWILFYGCLTFFVTNNSNLDILVIPFAIAPIVIQNFYNQRLAFITHIVIMTIISLFGSVSKDFIIMNTVAGIVVVILSKETRYWTKFFLLLLFLFITYVIVYIILIYIKNDSLLELNLASLFWLFLNVFFTLLAYPLIPLLERIFGFTSNITLSELTDLNNTLIKDMSIKAPGTFQHSLHVATLAEAAAEKIGANATLAKVGALYHDIGKIKNPNYFNENQTDENPHNFLEYEESAKIIIDHVAEGVRLAKKERLPAIIIDFIKTHHGTTRVEYFYRKFKEDHPEHSIDEKVFTYPGPRPRTKEQTIVMMADTVEAATKSLSRPKEADIINMVDSVIKFKMDEGQFDLADITFDEINNCKKVFKTIVLSMNHTRIVYPDK